MDPFLTVEELQSRLPWALDDGEKADAAFALALLSDEAREYGKATWYDAASTPNLIVNLVVAATKRYLGNSDGLVQSRAGDETLVMPDLGDKAGSPYFTENEIKLIKRLGGRGGIVSVPTTPWRTKTSDPTGYVPVAGYAGEKPFPYYADGESPW